MKVPCCSVCQTRYNEDERVPLLLQCGHGFCKDCLSRMFASSPDTTLSCPRCRHVTVIGNSVQALRKNYALLALIHSPPNASSSAFDCDFTDDDVDESREEEEELNDDDDDESRRRRRCSSSREAHVFTLGCGSGGRPIVELSMHQDFRLVKQIGEGKRAGVEMWMGVLCGSGVRTGRCRHRVAVKKVAIGDETDIVWVQGQLENLRRASMWCRNVCNFHGVTRMESSICVIMDKCCGSVQSEMQRNEGRLTLEQILRYGADIARGVAELHAAGIVCMNIKPSNLLLDARGCAVVSDYGLPAILKRPACLRAQSECDSSRIHSCVDCTMLTPNYTAPEAWEPAKKSLHLFWDDAIGISAESDAWSFGCTLVEMCTGSIPWAGSSADEIYRLVVKARKQPPQYASVVGVGIPRDLWKMIGECLHFKASKRPTFNAMLAIFLRHLQEIHHSPPASPDNDFTIYPGNMMEQSLDADLEISQDNSSKLHRLVSEGNVVGVSALLDEVASRNNRNSIDLLLEAHNADGLTALHLACRRGCTKIVEAIMKYECANANVLDKDGDPPLVFALAAGSPECVCSLIQGGADIQSSLREGLGPSFAHVSAFHGQPDCMRLLLLAGADPNAVDDEGESVLHRALAKKYSDCAIVILENGGCRSMALLNSKNLTPLHLCVATWNVSVVKKWVEVATSKEIADAIDVPGPLGSALCMAASLKKYHELEGRELVQILLAAGADPTLQDPQHARTALHMASVSNDVELVKIILDAGVDINIRNVSNLTPLHVALSRGANSCVGLLLSAGADCNMQNDEGDNAFHIAAESAKMIRENLQWIIVMLRYPDAAIEVRNHSGKTLRDFLEALHREWISEDLMEAIANKGIYLTPTIYDIGDWVKFKRSVTTSAYGLHGTRHKSVVGFVQNVLDKDNLIVSFSSGEVRVLANDVIKLIPLDRGQHVRLKQNVKEPRFGWRGQSRESIGTVLCVDDDGILRVGFPGASRGWKADPSEMERVEEFKVGDWVRVRPALTTTKYGLGQVTPGSIGIVYCILPDSSLYLELSHLQDPWHCEPEEIELVVPFTIGDRVCVKRSVAEPRYAWGGESHHSVGKISDIENDGLLMIEIPNRAIPWQADPSDMEKVEDFKVGEWVKVKPSVSSPKYGWENVARNSIGVIHSLDDDGDMGIAFCFRSKLFCCSVTDVMNVSRFEVGQEIRVMPSVSHPHLGWSNETPATVGKVLRIDMDGCLNVKVAGRVGLWKVSPGDAERLSGFEVGDWVRSKPSVGTRPSYDWNSIGKDSLAVVHSVQDNGYLELACCFRKGRCNTHYTDVEKVPSFRIGHRVRFRENLVEPRWGWRGAAHNYRGVVTRVHADGELRVFFSGLSSPWRADPADLTVEDSFGVGEWVKIRDGVDCWKSVGPGCVGIIQGIGGGGEEWEDGSSVFVAFCFEQERWVGHVSCLERTDRLIVGQKVRLRSDVKNPRFGWCGQSHGTVGSISDIEGDGKLRVFTESKAWMLDPSEVEAVKEDDEIVIGDWVRVRASIHTPSHQWGDVSHRSVGVVHRIEKGEDGVDELLVGFCFLDRLWVGKVWEMEKVLGFKVGDKVRMRDGVIAPRWGWGMETFSSRGEVVGVDANGKLRIKFRWREGRPWLGDPADVVLDS